MNIIKTKKIVIVSGFLVIVCVTAALLFKQLQFSIVEAQNQSLLTLEISSPQRKYLQLEPIPLNVKLSNNTGGEVKWNGNLEIGKDINFLVSRQGVDEVRWSGREHIVDAPTKKTEDIQSGANKEVENLIDESTAEELFPAPGRYQLRVEFNYLYLEASNGKKQSAVIVSNPITIDINEPKGNDRKAYDYLKNIYQPVKDGDDVNEKIRARQYFADNFADSAYWKYMVFYLATTYSMFDRNEKAEREFLKIADTNFYYAKEVRKELRKVGKRLGRSYPNLKEPESNVPAPVFRSLPVPRITPGPPLGIPPVPVRVPTATPTPQ